MPELMTRYGIKIHNNMCSCPWHEDKHPSMKVFKDGANCFACGWNGDIFAFVQKMDGVDFKTAFKSLGGSYATYNGDRERRVANMRRQSIQAENERKTQAKQRLIKEVGMALSICRKASEIYEPLSDGWCYAKDNLPYIDYIWQLITDNQEIDEINVHRKCEQIRQRFL